MSLEALANEVLYEIFEYLDAVELFQSFYNLNRRFSTILLIHFRAYRVNFHFVLKYQSNFLSRYYLPLITNQIISLHLSDNNDETPPQTDLFLSSGLLIKQFTHLRSLSLYYIDCDATMRKLMMDCHQLPNLSHLKVIKCHAGYMSSIDFSKIIWSLSNLTHCRLDTRSDFAVPIVVSSSLEYFSISCGCWGLRQILNLLRYTTHLRYLHIPLNTLNKKRYQSLSSAPSIVMLKLSDVHSLHGMVTILQIVPNLTHLKVDADYINCDGHRWEELIDMYLPKLKVFHLRMRIDLPSPNSNEKYLDKLLDTFRSSFWLEKHQWFVRCHCISHEKYGIVFLYTIPYGFVDCHLSLLVMPYKSTCPRDNHYDLYDRVKNLSSVSSAECLSFIRFPHIRNLSIKLCFDTDVWKNVPIFFQLISVTVLSADVNAQFHLQSLLDRSPHLHSLTIRSWSSSEIPVINNTNISVRRLNLQMDNLSKNYSYFSDEACEIFIRSSLGMQCEELFIKVEDRESILKLVNGMPHLRILQIQYWLNLPCFVDYKQCEKESEIFIKWLQNHLPLTCTVVPDYRNHMSSVLLKIWLHLEK